MKILPIILAIALWCAARATAADPEPTTPPIGWSTLMTYNDGTHPPRTLFYQPDKSKLAALADYLASRANHTGTQDVSSVTGAATAASVTAETARATAVEATKASAADLSALAAKLMRPVTVTVAVPKLSLLETASLSLAVPGALPGGAVVLNWTDVTMQSSVAGVSVTAPGVVTVTLKATIAVSAGNRAFTVAVINP